MILHLCVGIALCVFCLAIVICQLNNSVVILISVAHEGESVFVVWYVTGAQQLHTWQRQQQQRQQQQQQQCRHISYSTREPLGHFDYNVYHFLFNSSHHYLLLVLLGGLKCHTIVLHDVACNGSPISHSNTNLWLYLLLTYSNANLISRAVQGYLPRMS